MENKLAHKTMIRIRQLKGIFSSKPKSTPISINSSNSTPAIQSPSDPNIHVKEFLNFYLSFAYPPEYAVMLNGPWGIGKTYLMRQILDDYFARINNDIDVENSSLTKDQSPKEHEKYIYVSLYGKKSPAEIDNALISEIYPLLSGKLMKIASNLAAGQMKKYGITPEIGLEQFLNKFSGSVYVFDDLERCPMSAQEIMGYINEFVEQKKKKVILIANESEFKQHSSSEADYSNRREKTIGKTLEIQPSHTGAFDHFIKSIQDLSTNQYLQSNASSFLDIFERSSFNNLRILQQSIWDFERLFMGIKTERKKNLEGMSILSQLFFALSLEAKAGKIKKEDLTNRRVHAYSIFGRSESNTPKSPLLIASEKYISLDLSDSILSDQTLIEILLKGIIDQENIESDLSKSHYFIGVEQEVSWRTIWHLHERTDNEIRDALEKLLIEFENQKFSHFGELMHVVGALLWAAKNSLLQSTADAILKQSKTYVDGLYASGLLAQKLDLPLSTMVGWGGLEVLDKSSTEMQEFIHYFDKKNTKAIEDKYPVWAKIIFDQIKSSNYAYLESLTQAKEAPEGFYHIPILSYINPIEFAEEVFRLEPISQRHVFVALNGRYEHNSFNSRLAGEQQWLKDVHSAMLDKLEKTESKITKARFSRFMNWGFNEWQKILQQPYRPLGSIEE